MWAVWKSGRGIRVSRFVQRFWSFVMYPWMSPMQIVSFCFDDDDMMFSVDGMKHKL